MKQESSVSSRRWGIFGVFAVLLLVAIAASSLGVSSRKAEAAFPGDDNVSVTSQGCLPNGTVQINLSWTTYSQGSQQWIDLSLFANNFAPGTFVGLGPLATDQANATWNGLVPGAQHYLRVNTLTSIGWVPSATITFVTRSDCQVQSANLAASNLNVSSQSCAGSNLVNATLSWTPSGQGNQWNDISSNNNGFAPGTFTGMGPLPVSQSNQTWTSLQGGTTYYTRVNTLTSYGWFASQTISFQTRSDCGTSTPPPPTSCVTTSVVQSSYQGCITTDKASYAVGENVTYCYTVNQPMNVRIIAHRPDGTTLTVVDGYDDGTGGCISTMAGLPIGTRVVDMYGGPSYDLLDEISFTVHS